MLPEWLVLQLYKSVNTESIPIFLHKWLGHQCTEYSYRYRPLCILEYSYRIVSVRARIIRSLVLRDSHRGIAPATVVYVYTSNTICSLLHEFLSTVLELPQCRWRSTPIDQVTNRPISPDGRKIALVSPYFPSSRTDKHIHVTEWKCGTMCMQKKVNSWLHSRLNKLWDEYCDGSRNVKSLLSVRVRLSKCQTQSNGQTDTSLSPLCQGHPSNVENGTLGFIEI